MSVTCLRPNLLSVKLQLFEAFQKGLEETCGRTHTFVHTYVHIYAHINSQTRTHARQNHPKHLRFLFLCVCVCLCVCVHVLHAPKLTVWFVFYSIFVVVVVGLLNLPGRYHLPNVNFRRPSCCISHFYNWTQYVYRWKYLKLSAHLRNHFYCTKKACPYHRKMHYNIGHYYTFHTINDALTRDAFFTKQKEMKRNRTWCSWRSKLMSRAPSHWIAFLGCSIWMIYDPIVGHRQETYCGQFMARVCVCVLSSKYLARSITPALYE